MTYEPIRSREDVEAFHRQLLAIYQESGIYAKDAEPTDAELMAIRDKTLLLSVELLSKRVAELDYIGYAERLRATNFESHFVALKSVEWAADDLGIAMPAVRWFSEAAPGDKIAFRGRPGVVGKALDDCVWVHVDRSPREAIATAAHETFHLWQLASGEAKGLSLDELEAPAYAYDKITALKVFGKYGHGQADTWRVQAREAMRFYKTEEKN